MWPWMKKEEKEGLGDNERPARWPWQSWVSPNKARGVGDWWAEWAITHTDFGRSVNPESTKQMEKTLRAKVKIFSIVEI